MVLTFTKEISKNDTDAEKQSIKKSKRKKRHRDKSDLGENFVAPDGGWAWLVCLAAGCSNFFAFPALQQFGFLFSDHLLELGFSNSQITSVINIHAAISAGSGLLNGPIFKRFTFRQVALVSGLLIVFGLLLTSMANSFITYIITFSVFYGLGFGISLSSSTLALNTYFKKKRRIATGIAWTITSFGPIIMPYVATNLLTIYGVRGTLMLFSGLALHIIVAAMIYQPVEWHVRKEQNLENENPNKIEEEDDIVDQNTKTSMHKSLTSIFSSQYLGNEDDVKNPSFEIIGAGIPMLSQSNDGLSNRNLGNRIQSIHSVSTINCHSDVSEHNQKQKNSIVRLLKSESDLLNFGERTLSRKLSKIDEYVQEKQSLLIKHSKNYEAQTNHQKNINGSYIQLDKRQTSKDSDSSTNSSNSENKLTLCQKISLFFDLDLFKDFTYVNLMVGMTFANFAELNFSILTPFVLKDFGYTKDQAALAISLLAALDTLMRFLIPFIAEKIGWSNQAFYLIGVLGMALGRIIIAHMKSFTALLIAFVWIGLNKGLRTIFMALVIPSHVPLKKLPAASGLQLLFSGLFCLAFGPLVGFIRDKTDYTVTLHCLNIATYFTAISWSLEWLYRSRQKRLSQHEVA